MTLQTFSAGEVIIAEGTSGSHCFLIEEGQVLICKTLLGKQRIPIATLVSGELFGEMSLFDESGIRSASAIAETEVTVQLIPRETLSQALSETPTIIQALLKTLSSRLAQTSQQNTDLKAILKTGQ